MFEYYTNILLLISYVGSTLFGPVRGPFAVVLEIVVWRRNQVSYTTLDCCKAHFVGSGEGADVGQLATIS